MCKTVWAAFSAKVHLPQLKFSLRFVQAFLGQELFQLISLRFYSRLGEHDRVLDATLCELLTVKKQRCEFKKKEAVFSARLLTDRIRAWFHIVKCVRRMSNSRHGTVQSHASSTRMRPANNHCVWSEPTKLHAPRPLNRPK